MAVQLNKREKKTVLLCAVAAGLMLGYFLVFEPLEANWKQTRVQLASLRQQVKRLAMDPRATQTIEVQRLIERLPVLAMPQPVEKQRPAFQEAFTRQLSQAGLKPKRLKSSQASRAGALVGGFKVLMLESEGRGKYDQILKLLADLPNNPYYGGVQRLRLQADDKKRDEMNWELKVFTCGR